MKTFALLTGSAGLAMAIGLAVPAAAQPAPYGYGYPNQPYATNQNGGVVGALINQVLGGGRYGAYGQGNDRVAVDQCARAAETRATRDFRPNGYGYQGNGYNQQGYGYGQQGYGYNGSARVVGITGVERRNNGLKISGLINSGMGYQGGYPNQGYPNQGYANNGYGQQAYANQAADLRFSCKIDYRGMISDVRINRNVAAYRNR